MDVSVALARRALAAVMLSVLSACTGNDSSGCIAIPTVIGPTPRLISPVSGTTGVSSGPLDVTIGDAFSVSSLFVTDGSGNVTSATNLRQANPPASDVRIGTFAQLASHTAYQVYAVVPGVLSNPGCSPIPAVAPPQNVLLGSFTTR